MAAPLGSRMRRAVAIGAAGLAAWLLVCWSSRPLPAKAEAEQTEAAEDEAVIDPLGPNAACYVCHMTFVREELSKVHLVQKVTCVKCHGVSAGHANDEDIGATPPDITYKRHKVDASCSECHKEHDVSPRKVVARWLERKLSHKSPVCTDCHGTHKIERPEDPDLESDM
jgi:hypothetical protein